MRRNFWIPPHFLRPLWGPALQGNFLFDFGACGRKWGKKYWLDNFKNYQKKSFADGEALQRVWCRYEEHRDRVRIAEWKLGEKGIKKLTSTLQAGGWVRRIRWGFLGSILVVFILSLHSRDHKLARLLFLGRSCGGRIFDFRPHDGVGSRMELDYAPNLPMRPQLLDVVAPALNSISGRNKISHHLENLGVPGIKIGHTSFAGETAGIFYKWIKTIYIFIAPPKTRTPYCGLFPVVPSDLPAGNVLFRQLEA